MRLIGIALLAMLSSGCYITSAEPNGDGTWTVCGVIESAVGPIYGCTVVVP